MKRFVPALAAAFIATIGAGSAAHAAVSVIDFSGATKGPVSYSGGTNLFGSTTLDLSMATLGVTSVGTDDNASGASIGTAVTISPMVINYGSGPGPNPVSITKTWTGAFGTFTEDLSSADIIRTSTPPGPPGAENTIIIELFGKVFGPTGSPFDGTPAEMILTASQVAGPGVGHAVGVEFTNYASVGSNSDTVPEPSTWVMMALGFAGLGYAAVRRRAKNRSALAI